MSERAPVHLAARFAGRPDAPVLVLGNSLGTSSALWSRLLPALTRHFRVLQFEHRGHGVAGGEYSPDPPGPYSIEELGSDVLALLDRHAIERALYCGVSLGGMIGMWLAAAAPHRVSRLAVCCTSPYLPPATLWTDRAAAVRTAGPGSIAATVVRRWFTPAFAAAEPAVPAEFVGGLAAIRPAGYAGCCEAIAAMDLRPRLGRVSAPTLVIAGTEDPATPPRHAAVIAAGIPGARLQVIRGASHLAVVSHAAEVAAALVPHLRDLA
jgi:3-oxoadipate enol-lactonase